MFGTPIATSPHATHISELAWLLVILNMRGRFTMILINMAGLILIINPNWPLWQLKLIRPIQEGLALNFLLRGCVTLISMTNPN